MGSTKTEIYSSCLEDCRAAWIWCSVSCVHNVAHSSDGYNSSSISYHHFISMLHVRTVEAPRDKHKGKTHTAVWAVRFTNIPTQHTHQLGVETGKDEETERSLLAAVCLWKKIRYGRVVLCCVTSKTRAETACESYQGKCMCTSCWILCCFWKVWVAFVHQRRMYV